MKNTLRLFPEYSKFCILNSAFCIFLSAFCFGQEIEWQNTLGGSGSDQLFSISPTVDGGYICGGWSNSNISGDKTENCLGSADYWIVKLDSGGNIQWQNTIGGSGDDRLYSISQTTDGGYICGGSSKSDSTGDKTENMVGGIGADDYWIIKLDATGVIEWQNTIGGLFFDILKTIKQTTDGGYICAGNSDSYIGGDKTESCRGSEDYWVVKIDSIGNIQWQKTLGGSQIDDLSAITQTTDGGYICAGYSYSSNTSDKTEPNWDPTLQSPDYWIVKLDSAGSIQWQNTIGGTDWDALTSITATADGGCICGGLSYSGISGDKTKPNRDLTFATADYWVVKLNPSGTIQWQNTIGGDYDDFLSYISQTTNGGYICAGNSNSGFSGDKTENHLPNMGTYYTDYWIVKLDTAGIVQWQNVIGGNNDDMPMCITEAGSGEYICGGYSMSGISYDKTENCKGFDDYWIIKLSEKYNSITGNMYADANSNNLHDAGENNVTYHKVVEQNTGCFTFSNQNGFYHLTVPDTGSFTVVPDNCNYYNTTPLNQNVNFYLFQQTDSINNFAFQPTGVYNDLCITITPTGLFRSGFNASYIINYQNVGTTTLAGEVIFFPWNNVTYGSSNVTPTSIALDSIVWNTGLLAPFQSGNIIVTVNVNAGLPIGTLINSSVRIEPVAGDANPGCNYSNWEIYTTGSIDPNNILVNKDTLFTTQLPSQPWLDYTIRFQNTGNDTAFTVNVLNPIDTNKLELSSIEFVNSSHPVNLNWIPWERNMEFKFNNILLPDSNINEPLSHGFAHYRIKPKASLPAGNSITNNAYIYFDFNAPVATNTAVTKIILPTGIAPLSRGEGLGVRCFPNPAKDEITIAGYVLQNSQTAILKIYDVMGKEVFSQSLTTLNIKLQTLNFSSGVYFVQLQTGAKIMRVKFIKQ